jgi:putative tricarboxylic transport membrane protein
LKGPSAGDPPAAGVRGWCIVTEHTQRAGGPSHRTVEIWVALVIALFGVITMVGSLEAGIDWGVEGPKSGFFPFYVGLIIVIASGITLIETLFLRSDALFAEWGQLRQVLAVVIPTAIYVALIPYIGIYIASVILIATFMHFLGHYNWVLSGIIGYAVSITAYWMFEKWFLVPLPKGPMDEMLFERWFTGLAGLLKL